MIIFRKARSARQTKNDLDAYLKTVGDEPVRWLAREVQSWGEFSYAELENLIISGGLNDLIDWQSRWADVINQQLAAQWQAAMTAAAKKATKGKIILDDSDIDVKNWLKTRGGELITVLSEESKKAVAMVILRGQAEKVLPKKIAQQIRPLIGLNERQAQANMTYRQRVYQNLLASGLPPVTAEARAAKAALRYAGKQHRERADMIVNTELAFAYNRGADIGIKRAIKGGYMGRCEMVWTTAGTNRVCPRCLALKDKVVGHTDEDGVALPPLHPRCRCAIMYREVEKPETAKPQNSAMTENLVERHKKLTSEKNEADKKWKDIKEKIYQAYQAGATGKKMNALYAEEQKIRDNLAALDKELKAVRIEGAKSKKIFMTGLERGGYETTDIASIAELLSNAPEDFRLLWNLNEDAIKILDKELPYRQTPHYAPFDRGIRLNAYKDRTDGMQKPFKTLFHETGHLLDHRMYHHMTFNSTIYKQGEFLTMLKTEGKEYLNATLARLKREAIAAGKSTKEIKIANAHETLSKELRTIELVNRREVSDIWDGVTKGKANGGFGHTKKYWKEDENFLANEAFAHMFCATVQNPESLVVIKKYFPKSYGVFEKMVKEYVSEEMK